MEIVPNEIKNATRADADKVQENFKFFYDEAIANPYKIRTWKSSFSVLDGGSTVIDFNNENFDLNGDHTIGADESYYTAPQDGYYYVYFQIQPELSADILYIFARIRRNDTTQRYYAYYDTSDVFTRRTVVLRSIEKLNEGDKINFSVVAHTNSGSDCTIQGGRAYTFAFIYYMKGF